MAEPTNQWGEDTSYTRNHLLIKQILQGICLEFEVKVQSAVLACCMPFFIDRRKRGSYYFNMIDCAAYLWGVSCHMLLHI